MNGLDTLWSFDGCLESSFRKSNVSSLNPDQQQCCYPYSCLLSKALSSCC